MAKMSNAAFRQLLASIKSCDGVALVPVGRREFAKVDAEDFEAVRHLKWRKRGNGYAATLIDGKLVRMHRLLLPEVLQEQVIDHINGDGLDNRRANLRVCTVAQNAKNRRATSKPHSSRFKGVYRDAGGWVASISVDCEQIRLGRFPSEVRAAYEYDRAARRYHGEFAKTNADLGLL